MPMSPTLQEDKRKLLDMRMTQKGRFDKAKDPTLDDSKKHDILEEIKRYEPEIASLHEKVVAEETLYIAEEANEKAIEAMNAPDRRTPFGKGDAARSKRGLDIDIAHRRGLGDMIAHHESVKTFRDMKSSSNKRDLSFDFDEFKSLGEGFLNPGGLNDILEGMESGGISLSPAEMASLKATFTTANLTNYDRQPGIVLQGVQMPTIASLIPQGETGAPTIRYVREVAFTPAAAAVAEGGLKPEATWSVTEVDARVAKIAVITRMTEELLEDFPAMRDYINQRLPFMVELEEDNQLLNGDGTGANLRGVLNTTGILTHTQGFGVDETTAIAGDTAIDALLRSATRVAAESHFEPTGIVLNPFKWMDIRLTRSGTGDAAGGAARGLYLLGNPNDPAQRTLWGYPVVATTRIAVNTGVVAAWNLACQIFRRKGITVEMTNTDGDDWKYNRVALRAEERLALATYRPQAICKTVFA